MNDPEKRLIEALEAIDRTGSVAADTSPASGIMRETLQVRDLARYDHDRDRWIVTGTGRALLTRRRRGTGTVLEFRPRPGVRARDSA